MSNDTELFELCKEVYEKTGWGNYYEPDAGIYDYRQDKRKKLNLTVSSYSELDHDKDDGVFFEGGYPKWIAPLYTADYLLEKLKDSKGLWVALEYQGSFGWNATAHDHAQTADTPLKALLKLTLALHDADIELKEGSDE